MSDFTDRIKNGEAGPHWQAFTALIEDPAPNATIQMQADTPGHDLVREYVDHAHAVHSALKENWGITVDPKPGSSPKPVGEGAPRWYGVGQAPDYSKPGHPATPPQEPVPTDQYTPYHTLKHVLRTDSNRNLSRQFKGVPKPYVGGWRTTEFQGREGEDLVVEDQSTVHRSKDIAMDEAKKRNEQAVFESDTFGEIKNPHYQPS